MQKEPENQLSATAANILAVAAPKKNPDEISLRSILVSCILLIAALATFGWWLTKDSRKLPNFGPFEGYKNLLGDHVFAKNHSGELQYNFLKTLKQRDGKYVAKFAIILDDSQKNLDKNAEDAVVKKIKRSFKVLEKGPFIIQPGTRETANFAIYVTTDKSIYGYGYSSRDVKSNAPYIVINSARLSEMLKPIEGVENTTITNLVTSLFGNIVGVASLDEALLKLPEVEELTKNSEAPLVDIVFGLGLLDKSAIITTPHHSKVIELKPYDLEILERIKKKLEEEKNKSSFNTHEFNGHEIFKLREGKSWADVAKRADFQRT